MMKLRIRILLTLAACALAAAASAAGIDDPGRDVREWNFRVFLDDAEIGYHRFELVREDDTRRVSTEARFRVGFLFLTAYRYEHVNEETWEGDCLREIESRTDDNGREFEVSGSQRENRFAVTAGERPIVADDCVKTFAYWNPAILEEDRLLNSQTGELLPVTIERVAREVLDVKGEPVPAVRYRLSSRNLELDIWYSDRDEWLALESTVKGGRKLRYELT